MKEYLLKLYDYNTWANARVLGALEQQQCSDSKTILLFSHVMAAQLLWLHRVQGWPPPEVELWKQYSMEELQAMHVKGAEGWRNYIAGTEEKEFYRALKYTNYSGQAFENRVLEILAHTVNHATYHRGQIALRMREQGYEPINTDLITYERIITGQLKP